MQAIAGFGRDPQPPTRGGGFLHAFQSVVRLATPAATACDVAIFTFGVKRARKRSEMTKNGQNYG